MKSNWLPFIIAVIIAIAIIDKGIIAKRQDKIIDAKFAAAATPVDTVWRGWNKFQIPINNNSGKLIWYGHDLIANTSFYLGPKGTVAHITNGMNCQNCHLEGGTVPFGNNYGKVFSTYPKFRARNNGMQSIYARVNDCFERSLNGTGLDSTAPEMQAIYAYIKWLGKDLPKGYISGGTNIMKLTYLAGEANPIAGKNVYDDKCQSCHGTNGEGKANPFATGYIYPPLWGTHSYNDGAGLFRLSNFAGFVKNNMPYGIDYHNPVLTNEEAWNVAAFVNSQPRPHKNQDADWHDISKKPVDFPFGPYNDSFSEKQHKYGPFKPIIEFNARYQEPLPVNVKTNKLVAGYLSNK